MNYEIQVKRVKPNAKSCLWCKHKYNPCFAGESVPDTSIIKTTHRQDLKFKKPDDDYRYCKNYRYSKENFREIKDYRRWRQEADTE